jgi:hypothetical protein
VVGVYGNRGRPPEMNVQTAEQKAAVNKAKDELASTEAELAKDTPELADGRKKWVESMTAALVEQKPYDFVWLEDAAPGGATLAGAWNGVGENVFSGAKAWRQEAAGGTNVQHYFNQAAEAVTLSAGDTFFVYVRIDPANPPEQIMFQMHSTPHNTWNHRAFWGADKIPYGAVGSKGPDHFPAGELPKAGEWVRLEVAIESVGFAAGQTVDGFSFDQFGGVVMWDQAGVRKSGGVDLPALVVAALGDPVKQEKVLADHYKSIAPELAAGRERVDALKKKIDELSDLGTKTLITVSVEPRTMRVLPRGNWLDESGEVVMPAVPGFLANRQSEKRQTRMDLADWLVDPNNPLTARVFVNRVWKRLFGTGISKVLDDIGSQGEWPLHPELLDWLAVDFVESGWDIKGLIKKIVMSQAYQQSSKPSPGLRERDPYNRLLARQSSFRLDAELVRDQFLAMSGQLVNELGGPSVYPYQPAGLYRHLNFPKREYQASNDQNQWRRGVYTHWQRTFLHPMLKAFDAPSRDECAADRPRSNTPVQALALLNDPSQVEAARAFATRIVLEAKGDFAERVEWAFKAALSRSPVAAEVDALRPLYDAHLKKFQSNEKATDEYLNVGISKVADVPNKAELAAWMSVARAIFNLHEMITRY